MAKNVTFAHVLLMGTILKITGCFLKQAVITSVNVKFLNCRF